MADGIDLDKSIADYEEEKRVMLRCADLNPREDGSSIYMQRAVQCQKSIDTLTIIKAEAQRKTNG